MPWYVLYTKPKNEKKTALLIQEKGIEVYCPVQQVVKQWSDRKKKVVEPVFRSYVFVFLEDYNKENVLVLTTPGAVRFLWWLGKPGVVRDEEIYKIREFLEEYKTANAVPVKLSPQTKVNITSGALADYEATVLEDRNSYVEVVIESLGYRLVASINKDKIKIAPGAL